MDQSTCTSPSAFWILPEAGSRPESTALNPSRVRRRDSGPQALDEGVYWDGCCSALLPVCQAGSPLELR